MNSDIKTDFSVLWPLSAARMYSTIFWSFAVRRFLVGNPLRGRRFWGRDCTVGSSHGGCIVTGLLEAESTNRKKIWIKDHFVLPFCYKLKTNTRQTWLNTLECFMRWWSRMLDNCFRTIDVTIVSWRYVLIRYIRCWFRIG